MNIPKKRDSQERGYVLAKDGKVLCAAQDGSPVWRDLNQVENVFQAKKSSIVESNAVEVARESPIWKAAVRSAYICFVRIEKVRIEKDCPSPIVVQIIPLRTLGMEYRAPNRGTSQRSPHPMPA